MVLLYSLEKYGESREAWEALVRVREGPDFPVLPDLPNLPDLLRSIDVNQLLNFDMESIRSKLAAHCSKDQTHPHYRLGWVLSFLAQIGAQFPAVFNPVQDARHEVMSSPEGQRDDLFPPNLAQWDVDVVDPAEFKKLIRFYSRNAPWKPTAETSSNRKSAR